MGVIAGLGVVTAALWFRHRLWRRRSSIAPSTIRTSVVDSKDSWLDATDDSWLEATTDFERRTLPAKSVAITVDDAASATDSAPRRFACPTVHSDLRDVARL